MEKVEFFLLGLKGFNVLNSFLKDFRPDKINKVVIARDTNIDNDYYDEIRSLCDSHNVTWMDRRDYQSDNNDCFQFLVGWRWMVNPHEKLIVFHDSILPKYRGFSPLVNMLLNKEPFIGVTAIYASERYDEGEIILQDRKEVIYPITIFEAINMVSEIYYKLIKQISIVIFDGKIPSSIPQEHSKATYSLWRDNDDYRIDWSNSSDEIVHFHRCVGYPFGGAKCKIKGKIYDIVSLEEFPDVAIESRDRNIGKVIFFDDSKPVVICGKGLVKINLIKDPAGSDLDKISFRTKFE